MARKPEPEPASKQCHPWLKPVIEIIWLASFGVTICAALLHFFSKSMNVGFTATNFFPLVSIMLPYSTFPSITPYFVFFFFPFSIKIESSFASSNIYSRIFSRLLHGFFCLQLIQREGIIIYFCNSLIIKWAIAIWTATRPKSFFIYSW